MKRSKPDIDYRLDIRFDLDFDPRDVNRTERILIELISPWSDISFPLEPDALTTLTVYPYSTINRTNNYISFRWMSDSVSGAIEIPSITLIENAILRGEVIGTSVKIFKPENTVIEKDEVHTFLLDETEIDECILFTDISFPYTKTPYNIPINLYITTAGGLSYYILELEAKNSVPQRILGHYPFSIFKLVGEEITITWVEAQGHNRIHPAIPISDVTIKESCTDSRERKTFVSKTGPKHNGRRIAITKEDHPFPLFDERETGGPDDHDHDDDALWNEFDDRIPSIADSIHSVQLMIVSSATLAILVPRLI